MTISITENLKEAARLIDDAVRSLDGEGPAEKKQEPKLEDVRMFLAAKARVSKENTDAVRALLIKHGADKLSKVDPSEYMSLLAEAEVLPDAE